MCRNFGCALVAIVVGGMIVCANRRNYGYSSSAYYCRTDCINHDPYYAAQYGLNRGGGYMHCETRCYGEHYSAGRGGYCPFYGNNQ